MPHGKELGFVGIEFGLWGVWDKVFVGGGSVECFRGVVDAYRGESRHYHNLTHIYQMVHASMLLAESLCPDQLANILVACFYHDVVIHRIQNEERSEKRFMDDVRKYGLKFVGGVDLGVVRGMILATKDHTPSSLAEAVVCDADLSVLASPWGEYCQYLYGIKSEYSHVPSDMFRDGRRSVLERFIGRSAIFSTSTGRDMWEGKARTNILRELSGDHIWNEGA